MLIQISTWHTFTLYNSVTISDVVPRILLSGCCVSCEQFYHHES